MAGMTEIYSHGVLVQRIPNAAPYALLVPIIYRPDAKRPFGHSLSLIHICKRVLILAHRGELLDQAADKLMKSTGLGCATEKAEQSYANFFVIVKRNKVYTSYFIQITD